ncbi:putative fungal-specific transcription factor [Cladorrhinum sp. PSN259]|nr:putative fungal-specific transcription factor [Cladorrhinum sp. PSN259]
MSPSNSDGAKRQRRIGSRSCDACRIRKVKCTEIAPCQRCVATGIDCTFNKTQSQRGPRTLRAKTLEQIRNVSRPKSSPAPPLQQPVTVTPQGIPVESLVVRLCIYRLRLYPVWPIVAVEEIITALNHDTQHGQAYMLASALGAATMAQLKLDRFKDAGINDDYTAGNFRDECERMTRAINSASANLNRLQTSFFLHIYHENQVPGGTESLIYLREAITLAQIMGLHRPSSYLTLPQAEDRLGRRILWLLFVTERGVAMLHRLPVVLRSAEKLPALDINGNDDGPHVLPAFKKLVNLFWIFDQSRAFDILQDAADDMDGSFSCPNHESLKALQMRLQEAAAETGNESNDVQKADICITRQWMQILIWRAMLGSGYWDSDAGNLASGVTGPIHIARELLDELSRLPSTALEAHGPGIEFKIFEVASAVADSLNLVGSQPSDILLRLQRFLATSRGGNINLLGLLATRIAHMEPPSHQLTFGSPESHGIEEMTDEDDSRQPPASPWQSLVAAAGLEQQSLSYGEATSDLSADGGFAEILGSQNWLRGPNSSGCGV